MAREYPTILDLVGNTPIVRLDKLSPARGARILAKLEYLNPGGSVRDRVGLSMIEAARSATGRTLAQLSLREQSA